ncbi:MAG TPA: gliding motility-associated C-terminal domain-containing protein, partial [Edaphocola sp.]|nr:gliding motility-associated C-terminal domain-containing protein [Edaphocola sp.]
SLTHNGQSYTSSTLLSDTLHFTGHGCDSAYLNTYLWVHPADTQSVVIDTSGCGSVIFEGQTYMASTNLLDTISNQYGCDSLYRHVQVTVYNSTVITKSKDTVACDELNFWGHTYYRNTTVDTVYKSVHGCDSLLLAVRVFINHSVRDTTTASICRGDTYLFNGQGYRNSGVYTASFPYWNGCDSISVLILDVHELPDVTVDITVPPVQFCEGNPIVLQAHGAMSYHWVTDYGKDYGSGDSMAIIMVKPDLAVMTIGKDVYGCVDTAVTNLHSEPCCTIFMPNVFTPNGDGRNDLFGPGANGSFSEYRLEIFNRYGQRIFVAFSKEEKWDGTIGGQPAAMGTYFYRVMAKCMDGKSLIKQGDLTLMR